MILLKSKKRIINEKIRIGELEDSGESVFLEKHSWDCDWY